MWRVLCVGFQYSNALNSNAVLKLKRLRVELPWYLKPVRFQSSAMQGSKFELNFVLNVESNVESNVELQICPVNLH